jgi:FlaA1/EpsC-like NDP-sugar epimerase
MMLLLLFRLSRQRLLLLMLLLHLIIRRTRGCLISLNRETQISPREGRIRIIGRWSAGTTLLLAATSKPFSVIAIAIDSQIVGSHVSIPIVLVFVALLTVDMTGWGLTATASSSSAHSHY